MPIPQTHIEFGPSQRDGTSYNRYSSRQNTQHGDIIGPNIAQGGPETSPYYLYSCAELAELLGKAEVTIRLEARKQRIGTKKDGRWWFNEEQKRRMMESFRAKRRSILPGAIYSVQQAMMQRQDFFLQKHQKQDKLNANFHDLLYQLSNRVTGNYEEIAKLRRELDRLKGG